MDGNWITHPTTHSAKEKARQGDFGALNATYKGGGGVGCAIEVPHPCEFCAVNKFTADEKFMRACERCDD